MKRFTLIVAVVWLVIPISSYAKASCPTGKPDLLNVHLVCHTHDDVGWIKTFDQYYYGSMSKIKRAGVQYILDSVVQALQNDPEKKFIYVETAFFVKWWNEQNDAMKHIVRRLVCDGQLEFISGGWSMNDEAGTHYNSIIDQMTYGHRFLNDTFGKCGLTKVGWQIDPYGHSREQASLFAQMGFDGLFIGRLDHQDKKKRLKTKTMEHIWKANPVLGPNSDLFTGVLRNGYHPPPGFCFDITCDDSPMMDDPRLKGYNLDSKVRDFIKYAEDQASSYVTNHILMTMGDDFHYQNAAIWFKNLDKLMFHVNKLQANGSKINMIYSTPSCYLDALNKAQQNWPVKFDDYFPYSDDPHAFWSGYFSSRPSFKRYEKIGNNYLQVCKQLVSQTGIEDTVLDRLRDAMGIMQHHDAITGTARENVTNDYYQILAAGIESCQNVIQEAYAKLMPLVQPSQIPEQIFCNYLNISECGVTEQTTPVAITIYNPLAWPVSTYIRLPVIKKPYEVLGPNGSTIDIQIVPIPKSVSTIPERNSTADFELLFKAELPPLGYNTYILRNPSKILDSEVLEEQRSYYAKPSPKENMFLKNKYLSVTFGTSGLMENIKLAEGTEMAINQSFYFYKGMDGDCQESDTQAAGAYILRPNGTKPFRVAETLSSVAYVNGTLVQEVHQVFSPWLSQTIRLYEEEDNIELNWIIGPIPVEDKVGKEIIMKFETDLVTDSRFYTDANGRQILERIKDFRPTYKLNLSEPVAGNYYPANSRIFIQDKKTDRQLTILNDRSQGGASLRDGSLELLLHRRLLLDDGEGVQEPLNETGVDGRGLVIIGKHHLVFSKIENAASKHRALAQKIFMQPQISFATFNFSEADYMSSYKMVISGMKKPLPPNVHLLTLEPWKRGTVLIRLEHFYDTNDDPILSKPVKVELKDLFTEFKVVSIREVTLSANQFLDEAIRLQWKNSNIKEKQEIGDEDKAALRDLVVTLTPMKIRTFIAEIQAMK